MDSSHDDRDYDNEDDEYYSILGSENNAVMVDRQRYHINNIINYDDNSSDDDANSSNGIDGIVDDDANDNEAKDEVTNMSSYRVHISDEINYDGDDDDDNDDDDCTDDDNNSKSSLHLYISYYICSDIYSR
jgi:hypothetical protein